MKAYRCWWTRMPDERGIYIAATLAKAKYLVFLAIEEAGWNPSFVDLRGERAPEYDAWAAVNAERHRGRGLCEEVVKRESLDVVSVQV